VHGQMAVEDPPTAAIHVLKRNSIASGTEKRHAWGSGSAYAFQLT
jgi:hypothetical protein